MAVCFKLPKGIRGGRTGDDIWAPGRADITAEVWSLFWGWHVARVFLLPHSSVKAFQHSEVHRHYFSSKSFSRRKLNTFCGDMLSIRGAWWIKTWSEKFLFILSWKNMLSYSSGMRCDIKKLLSWRHSQVFHPCVRRVSSRRRVPERCRAAVGGRRGGAPFAIISPRRTISPSAGPRWQSTAVTHSEQVPQRHSTMASQPLRGGRVYSVSRCQNGIATEESNSERETGIKFSPVARYD